MDIYNSVKNAECFIMRDERKALHNTIPILNSKFSKISVMLENSSEIN